MTGFRKAIFLPYTQSTRCYLERIRPAAKTSKRRSCAWPIHAPAVNALARSCSVRGGASSRRSAAASPAGIIVALPHPGGTQAICHDATLVLVRQLALEHADATLAVLEEHWRQQVGSG